MPARIRSQRIAPALFRKSARRVEILRYERIAVIIRNELLLRQPKLMQIIRALRLQAFRLRVRKGRKIQRGQDTKDPNDDQKLY